MPSLYAELLARRPRAHRHRRTSPRAFGRKPGARAWILRWRWQWPGRNRGSTPMPWAITARVWDCFSYNVPRPLMPGLIPSGAGRWP